MMRGVYEPPSSIHPTPNAPYNFGLAASASSTSTYAASFWSDACSQRSDDSASTAPSSFSDSSDSYYFSRAPTSSQTSVSSIGSLCDSSVRLHEPWAKSQFSAQAQVELPAELRQNPRRTSNSVISRTGRPPSLVRQSDRKLSFVENLVDTSTHIVEAIWPTSSVLPRHDSGNKAVLPLRTFIQETLRRSRTSYSTLQVALYYLILIKSRVPVYDFTTEQPDDCPSGQAIQCGRRMFLAALILASKYLQDRNYSARAWSKISGLDTLEINQNEMAFLLAVNWKLHVTEELYKRWADCVSKFTPTQPPSPGGAAQQLYEQQCHDFRRIVLNLSPELDNLEDLAYWSPPVSPAHELPSRSLYTPPAERAGTFGFDGELGSASMPQCLPAVLEPVSSMAYAPGRLAPALGLLPTPRLTPQTSGFSTPAASAATCLLGRGSSMGFAMNLASTSMSAQAIERWPPSATSSPMGYVARRSSLANSVSTASSPESMVSDSSRLSRSSSFSSASSVSAPSSKLDAQARYRYGKLCGDRLSLRPTIASVPEDQEDPFLQLTSSPESYTLPSGKDFCDASFDTPLARREREMTDAARALQELQRYGGSRTSAEVKTGSKRCRANSVQDDVREMLTSQPRSGNTWPETMLRGPTQQVPVLRRSSKRICCSTEAAQAPMIPSLHPAVGGYGAPGMWEGILN
ncbi:hypothetical protein N658DRAFT_506324 [Parathielavia hyrcaniae]|uniref:G1/S-specific cyclin pas1 n=1 Tax=Parathielavia hyrcaniae TaxID=113614 RepID=A0AAN6T278_9PEZI|nr:hypothetical protein N658DRAFT_506324 [Parathielavia hyrcaniae]